MTKLATFVESRVGIGLTNLLLVHASVLSLLFLLFPQPITADVKLSLSSSSPLSPKNSHLIVEAFTVIFQIMYLRV